eukprot:gene7617-9120_t
MSAIDDLVALRQRSIDTFIVSGGRKKDASFLREQEAASFTADPALLTHPLYSTSIDGNSEAFQRSLESTIAKFTNARLTADALQLSSVRYYGSRDNKYGASCISFDQEGVLFACGGSNGIIKVYDFDECYAASTLRREGATVKPVVSYDTRRDVTCISWSHLRPDDIAVSYLFRPDIQVFDLSDADDASCDPKHTLVTDHKGSGGHNVVLYWHSVKFVPPSATIATTSKNTFNGKNNSARASIGEKKQPEQRDMEGIVAGSVTGYLRYWHTHTTNKSCAWNVMADPHRTALTATAVVSLQAIQSTNHSNNHLTLLLAATAQGVITLWDLNDLKAASFGSIQPEPRCVRRIDYTNQLLLYEGRTLIGVTPTQYTHCRHCQQKKGKQDPENKNSSGTSHICSDSIGSEAHIQVLSGLDSSPTSSSNRNSNNAGAVRVDSSVLLTTSWGGLHSADLNTERLLASSPQQRSASYDCSSSAYLDDETEVPISRLRNVIDPTKPVVLSYEDFRRELATAEQGARDTGSQSLRSVLPAVVPAWTSHQHLHQQTNNNNYANFSHSDAPGQNTLLSRLTPSDHLLHNTAVAADVAIVAVPSQSNSTSTVLNAYDVTGAYGLKVFPNTHNLNGLCSVSGKDSDPYSGVVRSNMRRSEFIATTLPGFIMTAEPGSYEIITSIDLQTYLCASVSSNSVYAKSSAVEFDWSTQDLVFGTSAVPGGDTNVHNVYENGVLYPHTTSANTVEGTSLHRLILQQAYVGPSVVNGLPRVYIRTSLLPSGRTATLTYNTTNHTNITHNNSIYSNSTNATTSKRAASVLPLHGNSRFPQQITALAAHPFYPVLVAGTHTDDVILLNPSRVPSAEDKQQEVYPIDTHATVTISADADISTSALASLDSAEVKAAELRAIRRALHRVGKALPRYDIDLPVTTHNEDGEVAADEKSISLDLEDAEMGDELPLAAPILSSSVNETGVQNGITRYGEAHPGSNDDNNAANGDGGEDDCSLTQLIEQYEVDPSVLTAAQLTRVRDATSSSNVDELLNSPLYKARLQMLRARAHHKADSALGNAVGKELELEVPDLAVFGAIGSPGRGSDLSSGDGTVTTMENTACEQIAVDVVDPPGRVSAPAESSHRSLSAIHSIHQSHSHTQREEQHPPQPAAKRAKMLGLFAATTTSNNTTNTATTASSKNKLVINSSNNSKYGGNTKVDVTTKSSSQTKQMNSTSSGPSTSGDSKRNTLSKLLQSKTLPPPLPSRVTLPLPAPVVKQSSDVHNSSDAVTSIIDQSSNSTRAVLSVVNGTTGAVPLSGSSNTTIGVKRALTSARAVTAAPSSDKSKPKSVSNILSFFSASKK